jgi:hypothetical protein
MCAFNTLGPSMSIQIFPIVVLGTNEIIGIKFACLDNFSLKNIPKLFHWEVENTQI